jgi:hypothetical protein
MDLVCPLSPHHRSYPHLHHSVLRRWTYPQGLHQHLLVWHIFHIILQKHEENSVSSTEEEGTIP